MANVKLIFKGTQNSTDYDPELQCFLDNNEVYIEIVKRNFLEDSPDEIQWISLDKPTAIRFAKTIRTEINKIREEDSDA